MRVNCMVCACVIIFDMIGVQTNVYKRVVYTVTNPMDGMNLFKCARFASPNVFIGAKGSYRSRNMCTPMDRSWFRNPTYEGMDTYFVKSCILQTYRDVVNI